MMKPLAGKVALVTGARAGIGAATVTALADLGATVVASGRHAGDCAAIVDAAISRGAQALDFAIDVADIASIPQRVFALMDQVGKIDILVNNAATIAPMAPLGEVSPLAFDMALRVNVTGPLALSQALWPHLVGGRIINIVSGAANTPIVGWAAYCASKAALLMLTRSMTLEGEAQGIKAFAFAPGLVDTAMQADIRSAHINAISDIPRENLLPAATPAIAIAVIAAGACDDLAGTYLDIRQDVLARRIEDFQRA